jgi:rhodanese-related sulfurtransferase
MAVERVTPEEAKELMDSGGDYIYLDVRTVQEFDGGHVPGAKNVPLLEPAMGRMQMNPHFLEIIEANFDKDQKMIVGCQKGGRSMKAAELLQEAGFKNVVDMRGGFGGETDEGGHLVFPGWAPRGLPVSQQSAAQDRYESLARAGGE